MSEEIRKPTALRSLNVLSSNAKVEQLRAEHVAERIGQAEVNQRAMSSTNAQDPTNLASAEVSGQDSTQVPGNASGPTEAAGGASTAASGGQGAASHSLIERAVDSSKTPEQKAIIEKIIDAIRKVYDPEIPINVYDLGLIYGIEIAEDRKVNIRMTLTAPGCPVAGMLVSEVERQAESVEEVVSAKVELVWEPQWGRHCMSEAALLELGLL